MRRIVKCSGHCYGAKGGVGHRQETISVIVSWQTEWRESGQSWGGHVAARLVQNQARGLALGASFKAHLLI
jgi:hypothetical protein